MQSVWEKFAGNTILPGWNWIFFCFWQIIHSTIRQKIWWKSDIYPNLRLLEQCGYVERKYQENNHKTIHLSVCDAASEIVRDGRQAQEKFWAIMTQGILEEDLNTMKRCMKHMLENIHHYMRKEPSDH